MGRNRFRALKYGGRGGEGGGRGKGKALDVGKVNTVQFSSVARVVGNPGKGMGNKRNSKSSVQTFLGE